MSGVQSRCMRSRAQSALARVPVRESARSTAQVATASWRPSVETPFPFRLSSCNCVQIHSALFRTLILSTGDVRL